jgi:two-component system, OmpR family, sensor histidine kinase VanS
VRRKGLGIFGKVFLYTLLFLTLAIGITAVLFARQFVTAFEYGRRQQVAESMRPFVNELQGKTRDEMIALARSFHEANPASRFVVQTVNGQVIFSAGETDMNQPSAQRLLIAIDDEAVLSASILRSDPSVYQELIYRTGVTVVLLFLAGTGGAVLFAHRMTKPIKKLAADTKKMSNLEPVPVPSISGDEFGQLTDDVHEMYGKLKLTTSNLEREIDRVRKMEENQRYFFSAASHELKTPIASASALLEGMLANIGDYQDHSKYLRECLNIIHDQSKLVSEIQDIVRLTDGEITPEPEPVHLLTVIDSVLPGLRILADSRRQVIQLNVSNQVYCHLDRKMFERVLQNVTFNAIQNTPEREAIEIWSEERDPDTVRLCILNTHAYIDEGVLARMFEPFYRLDKARTRQQGNSGLGLTIVKKTLDGMEIPFSLENTERGVLFWMDLPMIGNEYAS